MIARKNFLDVQAYLQYLREVKCNVEATVIRRRSQLRHWLEWADGTIFPEAPAIRPIFPVYLRSARNDDSDTPLAVSARKANCGVVRRFLWWAKREYPRRYRPIQENWIETIVVHERETCLNAHDLYTISELETLVTLPTTTLTEQRDQAAIAFLFLSGARSGAFVSLPICAVDLENKSVHQLPELGVNTKFGKSAITYLLDVPSVPSLFDAIYRWDQLVREKLPPDALWYATVTRDGTDFTGKKHPGSGRGKAVRTGLKRLCDRANIPYRPPHTLRHLHVSYAAELATSIGEMKAVSQNVMHEDIMTTLNVYARLSSSAVEEKIAGLTHLKTPDPEEIKHLTNSPNFEQALTLAHELIDIISRGDIVAPTI